MTEHLRIRFLLLSIGVSLLALTLQTLAYVCQPESVIPACTLGPGACLVTSQFALAGLRQRSWKLGTPWLPSRLVGWSGITLILAGALAVVLAFTLELGMADRLILGLCAGLSHFVGWTYYVVGFGDGLVGAARRL